MKIYVVNKELSSAHGTTAVALQFQGVTVYMRPEMNLNTNKLEYITIPTQSGNLPVR